MRPKSKTRMRQELAMWMSVRGHGLGVYLQVVTPWTQRQSLPSQWKTYVHVRPDGSFGSPFHTAQEHQPSILVRIPDTGTAYKRGELLLQLYRTVVEELATDEEKILMELA